MTAETTTRPVLTRARIIVDDSPESPREWDNLGVFVGAEHRSYEIGDRRPTATEIRALERGGFALLERYLRRTEGATHVLAVGMLDHSGVHFYVGGGAHWTDSAGWDSGTCGFIYDSREGREACGTPPELIAEALAGEIETYDQWASGDVYGYVIERRTLCALCSALDADDVPARCPHCDLDTDDSCWGFYGADPRENGMAEYLDAEDLAALVETYDADRIEYR